MKTALESRRYRDVFRRRAWIIALVVVLALGGTYYHLASQPAQYRAEASVLLTSEGFGPAALGSTRPSPTPRGYRDTVMNDIVHLLGSRTMSERAAAQVGGLKAEELSRRLTVKDIPGTSFLLISAVDERPERAALLANAVAQEMVKFYVEIQGAGITNARRFIDEQLRLAQERRAAAEQALLEFQTRSGRVVIPEDTAQAERRILELQAAYEAAALDETTARTRVAAIRSHLTDQNEGQLASLSITTNPVITQIRDHLTGLELQLADARQMYTEHHPQVQLLLGRIAADQKRLSAEAEKVLTDKSLAISPAREQFVREMIGGEVDAAAARARASGLRTILTGLQAGLTGVPSSALSLARLRRDVSDAEQLVMRLSTLQQDAMIRESETVASGQNAVVVVDQALAPSRPVPAPLPLAAAFAVLVGLCVGAGLALGVDGVASRRASRETKNVSPAPEAAPVPPMTARPSFQFLAAARGAAIMQLPVILLALLLGVALVAGVVAVARGQAPSLLRSAGVGPALTHAVAALHGPSAAGLANLLASVSHAGQIAIHAASTGM